LRIVIVDYGLGNTRSIQNAIENCGFSSTISNKSNDIVLADLVILPGVGSFEVAMKNLIELNLYNVVINIVQQGKYLWGICLGFQIMFEKGYENGEHFGLGLLKGNVIRLISTPKLRVPHIGWYKLINSSTETKNNNDLNLYGEYYFIHSYHAVSKEVFDVRYSSSYGNDEILSLIIKDNIIGTQFHPEKSGIHGLRLFSKLINMVDSKIGEINEEKSN
jgi:imidazole glycerol-phosphate synthase subunit HisH